MDSDDNHSSHIGVIEGCCIGQLGLSYLLSGISQQLHVFGTLEEAKISPLWAYTSLIIGPSHDASNALQMVRDIQRDTSEFRSIPPIIIFSPYADDVLFQIDAAYSGAAACIKTPVTSNHQVISIIEAVLTGQAQFRHEVIQGIRDIDAPSQREIEVLRLMADYCTNPEIAEALILSSKTIDAHVGRIFGRLRVNNRRDAIHRAKHLGWIR